jgi:hypothetical protein
MPKDIRDILKEAQGSRELKENHRLRFEERLQQLHRPKKKSNFFFLKIAASVMLLISVGYFLLNTSPVEIEKPSVAIKTTNLSSVSPEMKQIEDYYLTAINYEIASLEITPENQEILDDYLEKIGKLTEDYKRLNEKLAENGINEKTVNALITNLQLRLQLLLQLKDTLNELKTSKNEENENATI